MVAWPGSQPQCAETERRALRYIRLQSLIRSLGHVVSRYVFCQFGFHAGKGATVLLANFIDEVKEHLNKKNCLYITLFMDFLLTCVYQ